MLNKAFHARIELETSKQLMKDLEGILSMILVQ